MSRITIISMDATSSSTMYPRQCTKTSYGFWFPCLFVLIIILASLPQVCLWEVRVGLRRSQACEGPSRWVPPRITVFARCHRELCKHFKTDPFSLGRVFLYKMMTLKSFSIAIILLIYYLRSSYCHLVISYSFIHSNIPRQTCVRIINSSRFLHEVPMILYWAWKCGNCLDFTGHLLHLQSALLEGPRWLLYWDLPRVATGSRHGGIFWNLHTRTLGLILFLWQDPMTSLFVLCGRSVADVSLNVNRVAGFLQFQNLTDIMCGKGSITNDQQWSICHSQQTSANYELTLWKWGSGIMQDNLRDFRKAQPDSCHKQ